MRSRRTCRRWLEGDPRLDEEPPPAHRLGIQLRAALVRSDRGDVGAGGEPVEGDDRLPGVGAAAHIVPEFTPLILGESGA